MLNTGEGYGDEPSSGRRLKGCQAVFGGGRCIVLDAGEERVVGNGLGDSRGSWARSHGCQARSWGRQRCQTWHWDRKESRAPCWEKYQC